MPSDAANVFVPPTADSKPAEKLLWPLRDIIGYSCFASWAFLVGWNINLSPIGHLASLLDLAMIRGFLLLGTAVSSCVLLLLVRSSNFSLEATSMRSRLLTTGIPFMLCLLPSLTFLLSLDPLVIAMLWLVAGMGQSVCFFAWALRLQSLSSQQQAWTLCLSFVVAGSIVAVSTFVQTEALIVLSLVLPIGSYILLATATEHFAGSNTDSSSLSMQPAENSARIRSWVAASTL